MSVNPLAQELNAVIKRGNPYLMEMFSKTGRRLFFPKGILTQSAEAKQKAESPFNATIGIATEDAKTMYLPSVMSLLNPDQVGPAEALTYASSFGVPELREVWKSALFQKNPSLEGKQISLPVVTSGITHGISVFADLFLDPDDVVIFPDKMWGNNRMVMSVRGDACISQYQMFTESGGFNLEAFEERVWREADNNYKVVVFLNFPNNPTGYTITEEEGDRIADILSAVAESRTNIIAVTDDAYFGLRYEEAALRESLFARFCNRHPRLLAVKLDGATKEMFVWGLRVGFITYGTRIVDGEYGPFYDALERKTAGNIRGTVSNASHLSQTLVLKTLRSPQFAEERNQKVSLLKERANRVKEVVKRPEYADAWEMYPFNSGYFMCLRLKTVEAEPLRTHLLEKYGVGLIATDTYDIRIAFSSVDAPHIDELFRRIHQGIADLEAERG